MCRKPIKIENRNKYITMSHGQHRYIYVNCGECDECRRAKQLEWNLRTYYQSLDCLTNGGYYIYFDTLTYSNENLPKLSNFIETNKNYSCFNPKHIRIFYENLRQTLKLKKDSNLKIFTVSEYGDIRKRPHYHIMLFTYEEIEPINLSLAVAKAWKYGRTDGLPYKSKNYIINHNIITNINLDCIRYVAKYVNKSTAFMTTIRERWERLEKWYNFRQLDKITIKVYKRKFFNHCKPFHRESRGFGLYALKFFNIEKLINENTIYYKDDSIKINQNIQIPMYYKRKLFQKCEKYNGKRIWSNTDLGVKYKQRQEANIIEAIFDRLKDSSNGRHDEQLLFDIANYIYYERGRFKGIDDYKNHNEEAILFNYNTDKDLKYLGKKCISRTWAGNDTVGYATHLIEPIEFEIDEEVQKNTEYEKILNELIKEKDDKILVQLKEHLADLKKIFFGNYTTY